MAQFFYQNLTLPAVPTPAYPVIVKVGFQPAYIKVLNLTQLKTPTTLHGYKAEWWFGMDSPGAMITEFDTNSAATTAGDRTTYITTGGITILNPLGSTTGAYGLQMGTEQGQYGAVVSGFTNANPGVLTVDSTYNANITAGSIIRVANLADDQSGTQSLNGDYYVASVTGTTITTGTAPAGLWTRTPLSNKNTTGYSVYVSGGAVTVLQTSQATLPNPPFNINSDVPVVYNQAVQGFSFGQQSFPNGSAGDNYLIQCWDNMVQF